MVEKITITPNHIRGMGNIIDPKTDDDFTVEDCTITESTDTVNGLTVPVFELEDTFTPPTPTYIIDDDASSNNSSTLFGDSVALRNSGSNSVGWNGDGYYTITTQSSGQKESMRVLTALTGITDDFVLEFDGYSEQTDGTRGLVVYNSSSAWEKLTDDSASNKKYWYAYQDSTFHEQDFYGTTTTYQRWVHYKYTLQGTSFSIKVTEIADGTEIVSRTETLHFTRDSTTKYGLNSEWNSNRTSRYKNIQAYTI